MHSNEYNIDSFDADVLIVGAGPAGLSLAIELARHGVSFRLIDKATEPFPGSRGKGIQPRTLEIFEDMGIVNRIAAVGGAYPSFRTYLADGMEDIAMMTDRAATRSEPYPMPLMVPQFVTERVLRERLAELGSEPRLGEALVNIMQDDAGITAQIEGPYGTCQCRTRYLVGADGGRSQVRETLKVAFAGQSLDSRAIVADIVLEGLDRDFWHRFHAPDGKRATLLCPLAGTPLFQLQAPLQDAEDPDTSAEGLQAFIRTRTGRDDLSVQSVHWASIYAMSARLADRYRVGRAFLAGDAAHIHPPTGAQGLNTSVQDAYNLGWKLAAVLCGADDVLLDSYESERRPIAADMLGLSTRLLDEAKGGAMRRGRETGQLELSYPDSPLSFASSRGGGPIQAGDRAPDAPLLGAGGQRLRLFDLIGGTCWTLLGADVDRGALRARRGLRVHVIGGDAMDDLGAFRDAYRLGSGEWVLVRPDGYVAAVGGSDQILALDAYLDRFLHA